MTISMTEKEKKAIATAIIERIDEYLNRFPYARYPIEPLEGWRKSFCDPGAVTTETLRQALDWQFGGWQRKNISLAHRKTISAVVSAWPDVLETAAQDPQQAFALWQQKLPDWHKGFSAAALLLHLQKPDTFELADGHRLDTMIELLNVIDHSGKDRSITLSLDDIQDYTAFFRAIVPKLPYGKESHVKLDRFMKIYGNRHAYKLVSPDFKTQAPSITSFSWQDASSKKFRLDAIENQANTDILFACFLLTLEATGQSHKELTIGQVINSIPLGTGGICNPASYNYALVALFGGQKQRDFWIFHKPDLRHSFTEQANQSTRNMRYYKVHSSEIISVNPKYVV